MTTFIIVSLQFEQFGVRISNLPKLQTIATMTPTKSHYIYLIQQFQLLSFLSFFNLFCLQLLPALHFHPQLQIPQAELAQSGRSFSSGSGRGNTSITTLSVNETAATFLPASLFQSITNRTSVGIVFAVYDTGVLFPITNATQQFQDTNASLTTVVGSPVLGVTVGPGLNFSNLTEPVRILLRLNELEVSDKCEKCFYNVIISLTLRVEWLLSIPGYYLLN